jgi:hypothetical protein
MQYVRPPEELARYRPLWISAPFLKDVSVENGLLRIGSQAFHGIYVDVEWMGMEPLRQLARIAEAGGLVILRRQPKEPGTTRSNSYEQTVRDIANLPTVTTELPDSEELPPVVDGEDLPEYWVRRDGERFIYFFAHPATKEISYPLEYGQSARQEPTSRQLTINLSGRTFSLRLEFGLYESLCVEVAHGTAIVRKLAYQPAPARTLRNKS